MAQAGAPPPTRMRNMSNVGSHPMAGMSRSGSQLGSNLAGPPTALSGASSRPGWFKNVGGGSPREGFMGTVGVPPVSRNGPPSATMMDPSPNQVTPDTMGLMTNHSAPYAKIARALRADIMNVSQVYQILATLLESRDPVRKRKGRETRRYTMLNMPALNYFLGVSSLMPKSPTEIQSAEEFLERVTTSGNVSKEGGWSIEGVVRTEEGAEDMYKTKQEVTAERLFNCVVRGYAYTFNVFGPNAHPGTALYIIVKKVHVAKGSTFKVRPWDTNREAALPITPGDRTPAPFQFTFFGDYRHDTPPLNKLEYLDEFGFRHYGKAIFIGRVSTHAPVNPQYRNAGECYRDLSVILTMPQFHFMMDW